MTDPLGIFYTWPIVVERFVGRGSAGQVFAEPDRSLKARIVEERAILRNTEGEEVVSTARLSLPAGTPLIPPESRVELPAELGGRVAKVIRDGLHDAGLPIAFYRLYLT